MRKTVKKVASKKPMMQKGGSTKKPLVKAQTGKNVKGAPLTLYSGEGDKYEVDTNGYARRENNFYPYVKTSPAGAVYSGVFDNYDMGVIMPKPIKSSSKGSTSAVAKKATSVAKKKMAKGGAAHPGFKSVQAGIAAKQGVSKQAAGAILASATRKASPKAKAANPRLKRVKG